MYDVLFRAVARVGKPFGGIKPARVTHWLARKAYAGVPPSAGDYRWHRDRYGSEFLLHPHYIIDYHIIAFGVYGENVSRFIDRHVRPGAVCMDVGANIGVMGLLLAHKAGPGGRVYCFEPVPHLFRRLEAHVERNRLGGVVSLQRVALSDRSGTVAMPVTDESFVNQGMGSIVNTTHEAFTETIRVETVTLDEFAARERLERLDFVKVDIQGAEPLFLRGGRETLARFKPDLLMELAPSDLAGCGMDSRDLIRLVESFGYEVMEVTQAGEVGGRLSSATAPADLHADAVLCRARRAS